MPRTFGLDPMSARVTFWCGLTIHGAPWWIAGLVALALWGAINVASHRA